MTPEKLEHAKKLSEIIAQAKKHLAFMQKVEEDNAARLPDNFSIKYMADLYKSAGEIKFMVPWIEDADLQKEAAVLLKSAIPQLINIFQRYINKLEKELADL